MTLDGQ